MTDLDKALEKFQQNTDDETLRRQLYDLFLNSVFFVPTHEEESQGSQGKSAAQGQVIPLIIEAEGNDYLMLFDSEERLRNWAQAEVSFIEVPGHVIAAMSAAPLHWALNVGTEISKEFLPEEIAWLREVVERCDALAEQEQNEGNP
jgi:hypothetical protein